MVDTVICDPEVAPHIIETMSKTFIKGEAVEEEKDNTNRFKREAKTKEDMIFKQEWI